MKLENLKTLKIGDIIYSFRDNKFYVYKLKNIQLTPAYKEMTVTVISVNNVPEEADRDHLIIVPNDEKTNTWQYSYEFTNISKDINEAYQNYSENINRQIRKLNGYRANIKGLKRKYMIDNKMIHKNEKNKNELIYKSKNEMIHKNEKNRNELRYKSKNEYLNDLYDDLRHGYIG